MLEVVLVTLLTTMMLALCVGAIWMLVMQSIDWIDDRKRGK